MVTSDVKVGDKFIYTTPGGREIAFTVTELDALTPQRQRMPRAVPETGGRDVFIHDELLAQDWWRPVEDQAHAS